MSARRRITTFVNVVMPRRPDGPVSPGWLRVRCNIYRDCPRGVPTYQGEAKMCKKSRLAISSPDEFLVLFSFSRTIFRWSFYSLVPRLQQSNMLPSNMLMLVAGNMLPASQQHVSFCIQKNYRRSTNWQQFCCRQQVTCCRQHVAGHHVALV